MERVNICATCWVWLVYYCAAVAAVKGVVHVHGVYVLLVAAIRRRRSRVQYHDTTTVHCYLRNKLKRADAWAKICPTYELGTTVASTCQLDTLTRFLLFQRCSGQLPSSHCLTTLQDIRATEVDKAEIATSLRPGDIIRARVISLGDSTQYFLSTAENELGVRWAKSTAGSIMIPISWQVTLLYDKPFRSLSLTMIVWAARASSCVVLHGEADVGKIYFKRQRRENTDRRHFLYQRGMAECATTLLSPAVQNANFSHPTTRVSISS